MLAEDVQGIENACFLKSPKKRFDHNLRHWMRMCCSAATLMQRLIDNIAAPGNMNIKSFNTERRKIITFWPWPGSFEAYPCQESEWSTQNVKKYKANLMTEHAGHEQGHTGMVRKKSLPSSAVLLATLLNLLSLLKLLHL